MVHEHLSCGVGGEGRGKGRRADKEGKGGDEGCKERGNRVRGSEVSEPGSRRERETEASWGSGNKLQLSRAVRPGIGGGRDVRGGERMEWGRAQSRRHPRALVRDQSNNYRQPLAGNLDLQQRATHSANGRGTGGRLYARTS